MLFVGVDGGGSHTRAFAIDARDGRFAHSQAGPGNPSAVGFETAANRVREVVREVMAQLSMAHELSFALAVAFAGVGRLADRNQLRDLLQTFWPQAHVVVTVDPHAALLAGTCGEPGVVLIAGTGAMAFGVDAKGRSARAGGFGYLLGDEGSGFAIGQAGIAAALKAAEGRGPQTALKAAAARHFAAQEAKDEDLLPGWLWDVYRKKEPVTAVAAFAKVVVELRHTDPVAQTIVRQALQDQAALIRSVRERLTLTAPTVVLSGGLFGDDSGLSRDLEELLTECKLCTSQFAPVTGAVLLAMRETGLWREPYRQQWQKAALQLSLLGKQ